MQPLYKFERLPVNISCMTNTTSKILISWIHNSNHDSVNACSQILVTHINSVYISDCEPDDILTVGTSVRSKCIFRISEQKFLTLKSSKINIYLLKLFGGGDKATSVSISVIVEIGHLILLSIIKEFDVKWSISDRFNKVCSTVDLWGVWSQSL